eukprot:43583-Amphidinium_carterae.1
MRPYCLVLERHDDVVIVPEFFCSENDWDIYYRLIEEMRTSQAHGDKKVLSQAAQVVETPMQLEACLLPG